MLRPVKHFTFSLSAILFLLATPVYSGANQEAGRSELSLEKFLAERTTTAPLLTVTKCNYQYSDNACERSSVGTMCRVNNQVGICAQVDTTGDEADCRCTPRGNYPQPTPQPSPTTSCNYRYSDNACERSTVGDICSAGNQVGICAPIDYTGNEADCRCTPRAPSPQPQPNPPPLPPPPSPDSRCNYQYSDNACERSIVGAICSVSNQVGVCTPFDTTGDEFDCRCTPN